MKCLSSLALIFFLLAGSIYASVCSLSVEWLYMLPEISQPYFVIDRVQVGPVEFDEKRIANGQNWHSGYRAELACMFENSLNALHVRWTQFPTFTESTSVNDSVLIPVITIPAAEFPQLFNHASIRDTFDFHYLDLLFSLNVLCACRFQLDFLSGVQYGRLKFHEEIDYSGNSGENVNDFFRSSFWGIGLVGGPELFIRLSNCFKIRASGSASLLVSKREAKRRRILVENSVLTGLGNLKNDEYWCLIPMLNLRLGLAASRTFSKVCFSLEGGYELIALFDAIDRIFFTSPDPPQSGSIDEFMNFTLHGPYARFEIVF